MIIIYAECVILKSLFRFNPSYVEIFRDRQLLPLNFHICSKVVIENPKNREQIPFKLGVHKRSLSLESMNHP